MRISDWSSDVCSSDLHIFDIGIVAAALAQGIARYAIILPPRNGRRIIVEEVVRHEFEARPAIPAQIGVNLPFPMLAIDRSGAAPQITVQLGATRSEERRVGKECVSTCRSRWLP